MNNLAAKSLLRTTLVLALLVLAFPSIGATISRDRLDAVTAAIQKQIDGGKLAGAVTLASQDGQVIHSLAQGQQSLADNSPMQADTIFRIFSMTKPIAGTALMTLYDQGKFKLSDPVEKYIPEFTDLQVAREDGPDGIPITEPAHHKMTIRELMSHSGGLTYGYFSQSQVDTLYKEANVLDRNSSLQDMINKLALIPLWAQPGTRWQYSVSVDVQAHLVEVLSGMRFDEYLQKEIFTPLGMVDTAFFVAADKVSRLSGYYAPDGAGKLESVATGEFLRQPTLFSGGGGLTSTAGDYLRFAQMHLNGGEYEGVRILSAEAVALMRSNQLPDGVRPTAGLNDPGNTFGLDFSIVSDSSQAFGQPAGNYWWWGIAGTWFWIDPVNDFVFIGMIQTRDVFQSVGLHRLSKHLIYSSTTK